MRNYFYRRVSETISIGKSIACCRSEEDDPEDDSEVFEIDEEESGEKVQAIESLRFLRDASSKFQTRKIQQRGDSARLEMKRSFYLSRLVHERSTQCGSSAGVIKRLFLYQH